MKPRIAREGRLYLRMKPMYALLGIAMILAGLYLLKNKLNIYKVEQDGETVKMKILTLPNFCGLTKGNYYANFSYQGMRFNKRIPTGFCKKHKVGDLVDMKYIKGHHILFPNEKMRGEFIGIGILMFMGLLSIVYSFFKK